MNRDETMLRLVDAQARNGLLRGDELIAAATAVAHLARRVGAHMVAADSTGERIIGAVLVLAPGEFGPADLTQHFDDRPLLLISGVIAGPVGLAQVAARLRSLGAQTVHAAVLGGWCEPIAGLETITTLGAHYDCSRSSSTAA